ncbi:MAG: IS1380 family transposase [Chloroflexi bacterium]|nr:IS1380 family transposase [Chloroflexota bacterium]
MPTGCGWTRRSNWRAGGCRPASQPTLSRLENAVDRHAVEGLAEALADLYVRERGRAGRPSRILLDLDGTDDPAHGEQEGVAYHGYDRQHMYHPLLVFDGDTGYLITAVLRPGDVHGSRFVVLVLRRLLRKLRAAWPDIPVELRADSGFAIPRLYTWCGTNAVDYTIGLVPNPVLERMAAPLLQMAQAQSVEQGGAKVRLADAAHYQADSWPHARRVVFKAEIVLKGPNTRFVVTIRTDDPLAGYDHDVDRGESENWIKDFKNALHAAAYWLLDQLRRWLLAARAARLQLDTLRLRVIKIAGWVRERTDFGIPDVCLHLSSHHPGLALWRLLARASRVHTWSR